MNINGKTKIYGLIGNPIEHSISPTIHNFLASEMNQNMVYENFLVDSDALETAIKGAYELKIQGLNVTVPYKTQILEHLVSIDEEAKKIGAVNTLVYKENGYHGMNTDSEGLHLALEADHVQIEKQDLIILGAGGAARAVLFMSMKYSKKHIYLVNRTVEKARKLASEVNLYFNREQIIPLAIEDIEHIPSKKNGYLCIQTTSVGLAPNCKECLINDKSFYENIVTGYDIIYNPEETEFMKKVKSAGGKAYNGMNMLLFQAILSYETWRTVKVPVELYEKALEKMKEVLNERK